MKKEQLSMAYEAPLVEIIEVAVEKGFATSNSTEDIQDGTEYPFN